MNEREIRFLNELRAELRRATQQASPSPAHRLVPTLAVTRLAVPILVAVAVLVFVTIGSGGGGKHPLPVRDYSSSTSYQPRGKTKFVGSQACVAMYESRHLPPLIRTDAAPDAALMSELSLLRQPSTPIDSTSLGSWDRIPLMITTIYQRYERVLDGPRGVRIAFVPVDYCSTSEPAAVSQKPTQAVAHTTLRQGLVMLVLSNPGEHPPVLVGTAQQIKTGPALAGLDVSRGASKPSAWLQSIVVPDGVAKVVMKFTPPFLHHYSNTVAIQANVGIVVRNPAYEPTTILWYAADGRLIRKWVDHKTIAIDSCLAHHRKDCLGLPIESNAKRYAIAVTAPADPQAKALYEPMIAYARATSVRLRARAAAAGVSVGNAMNACDKPFRDRLFLNLVMQSKNRAMQDRANLYLLWSYVVGMQTNQAEIAAVQPQLEQLIASWAQLSLTNRAMTEFAHATAAVLNATLAAPKINGCAFVRAVAAHHFSYAWARHSSYGKLATSWWHATLLAGRHTAAFWKFVGGPTAGSRGGAGQNLFTKAELSALANLPGEPG